MRVGFECGQSWRSFRGWRFRPYVRRIPRGVAIGPMMIIRGRW